MPAPKQKAEATVKLCGLDLRLSFKSYNMMVLTDLTGKTPIEYFERFEGSSVDEAGSLAKKICDFSFIVPLLVAGLADHPEYENTDPKSLQRKVCKLIDGEAERNNKSLLTVVAETAGVILPAAIASLNVETTKSPNG